MFLKIILPLFFLLPAVYSQSSSSIQIKIDTLLTNKFFNSALIAADIYNLTKEESIYRKNEKMLLHPASNMKILTSTAALLFLGKEYKFQTSFYYTGQIINKTLYGDLYVSGGFDPDFTSNDLDSLTSIISSLGITEITGRIIGDVSAKDSLFWGKGWMWDDDPSSDAPYLSALNINKNTIKAFVRGDRAGNPAEIILQPATDYVNVINKCRVISPYEKDSLVVDRDWINRKNTIIIKGTVKKTLKPDTVSAGLTLNLFEPEKYFLTLFKEALDREKISGKKDIAINKKPDHAVRFFTFERTIDSVLINLNKTSDNLSAEMLLYSLAAQDNGNPASAERGFKFVDSLITLIGLNPRNYKLADGSGVSRYNLVSPELLLNILKFIYSRPDLFDLLYKSFPIAGVDGTLKSRMIGTAAENNVHAKTGTLSGVSALSGYLNSRSGDLFAFSILIQNYVETAAAAQFFIDEICRILAE